jgi:nitrite reductase/ring-hydroxylating ferredoxin subunit
MVERIEAANVGEVAEGEMKAVEAGDRTVVLINVDGNHFAIDDECTHEGCPLSEGYLEGDVLECSCHGSMFNIKTGYVPSGSRGGHGLCEPSVNMPCGWCDLLVSRARTSSLVEVLHRSFVASEAAVGRDRQTLDHMRGWPRYG